MEKRVEVGGDGWIGAAGEIGRAACAGGGRGIDWARLCDGSIDIRGCDSSHLREGEVPVLVSEEEPGIFFSLGGASASHRMSFTLMS
jgi:hypothetical protein